MTTRAEGRRKRADHRHAETIARQRNNLLIKEWRAARWNTIVWWQNFYTAHREAIVWSAIVALVFIGICLAFVTRILGTWLKYEGF